MFTAEDVRPGQAMTCTNDGCKKMFRLPKTLKAEAE